MKNYFLLIFLLTSVFSIAQVLTTNQSTTRAVVIGISDYQDPGIPDLRFADRDAQAFAAFLQSPAGGVLPPQNIALLTNENATIGKMTAAIDGLIDNCRTGDQAIIYFSGHGDVETRTIRNLGFLLTYDSPSNSYAAGAYHVYYLQTIMETLAEKGVQCILIADACHAGKLAGSAINGTQATAQSLARQFANEVKIMSCQPNEFSLEGAQWGGGRGAFSYHLVEGLYGMADTDNDLQITLREIGRYLEDQVTKETDPQRQTPYITGDPYRRLATIDTEMLTALLERKKLELPTIDKIESKGLEEVLLTAVDTNIQELYLQFSSALEAGNLLDSKDSSAYDLFQKLVQIDTLKNLHGLMRRNLAAAFQDDAQQAINAYMKADSSELNSLQRKDKRYFQYPLYLEKAAELLGASHYAYKNIMCKKHYFEGIVTILSMTDLNKKDSLYKASIRQLTTALEYEERAAYVYQVLGDRYASLKNKTCLEYYDKAIQLAPDWAMPWKRKGDFYNWTLNQFDEAETCFRKAIGLDSNYVWAYYGLGQLYHYQFKRVEEAEALYAKVLSMDSLHLYAPVNLAQIQAYNNGDIQGGIAIIRKHQKWYPDFYMYYSQLGSFYQYLGELEEAEKNFEKAVELSHDYPWSIIALARFKNIFGKIKEAEALWNKAIALDSSNVQLWSSLGGFYQGLGNSKQAEQCFIKVAQLNPSSTGPINALAWIKYREGQNEEAEALWNKAIAMDSTNFDLWSSLGMFYETLEDWKQAEKCFKKCLSIDSNSGWPVFNLMYIYNATDRSDLATQLLRKRIELYKEDFSNYNYLGFLLTFNGRYEEAIQLFEEEMKSLKGIDDERHIRLGQLYEFMGQPDSAQVHYRKVLDQPETIFTPYYKSLAYCKLGMNEEYQQVVKDWEKQAGGSMMFVFYMASVHAACGNYEQCLIWLEKVFQKGYRDNIFFDAIWGTFYNPDFHHIREMPEYQALMKKHLPYYFKE